MALALPSCLVLGNSFPVDSASSSAKWWASDVSGHQAFSGLHHPMYFTQITSLPQPKRVGCPHHFIDEESETQRVN